MGHWGRVVGEALRPDPYSEAVVELLRKLIVGRRRVVVSSVGPIRGIGRYLVHLVNSLVDAAAFYVEPHELMYYVAPYDEGREEDVLLVATSEGFNDLYMLLDQLVLTGHRVALITEPLPEVVRSRFGGVERVEVPSGDMGLLRLLNVLAYSVASLGRRDLSRRTKRILEECASMADVADELVERYSEELRAVGEALAEPHVVTYTPTMEPAAEFMALGLCRGSAVLAELPLAHLYVGRLFSRVLAFTTEVETYTLRYYMSRVVERGGRVSEVRLRTDPLTAPIYAMILLYYVAKGWTR